jgi:hypothetical protein
MAQDWQKLTEMTRGGRIEVERVRLVDEGIAIEGSFELPPLAQLSSEDQFFVAAFVRCHGSIKEMERIFGVSYPTVKNRLRQVGARLRFMDIDVSEPEEDALSRLERGEITPAEAVQAIRNNQ